MDPIAERPQLHLVLRIRAAFRGGNLGIATRPGITSYPGSAATHMVFLTSPLLHETHTSTFHLETRASSQLYNVNNDSGQVDCFPPSDCCTSPVSAWMLQMSMKLRSALP